MNQKTIQANSNQGGTSLNELQNIINARKGLIENLGSKISEDIDTCDTFLENQKELHKQVLALNQAKTEYANNHIQNAKAEEKILNSLYTISNLLENVENNT